MIESIAYHIMKTLSENVTFLDKWAGIVKALKKSVAGKSKIFPVSINTPTECNTSDYFDLVPDSTKMSVAYIEKLFDSVITLQREKYNYVESKLRIIIWYNLDKINAGAYVDEGVIIDYIRSNIPKSLPDSLFTTVKKVRISIDGIVTGAEIFGKYTYDEVRNQYLMFPYGAFGIDITVNYISINCPPDINPVDGCGAGMGNHVCSEPCLDFSPSLPNVKTVNLISPDGIGNIDLGFHKIYIQPNQPLSPVIGDLWIDTT